MVVVLAGLTLTLMAGEKYPELPRNSAGTDSAGGL